MKLHVRRLRLRKSTLREVTSDLAQDVMGGSVPFTKTCTYSICAAPTCGQEACQLTQTTC